MGTGEPKTPKWPFAGLVIRAETVLLHFKLLNVRGPATGGLEVKVAESNAADVKRQIDELDKKLGECRIELAAKRKIWASNHPKLQMLIREVDALQARRDELAEPGGR